MLKIENVYKTFNPGTINEKKALNGLNLVLNEGGFNMNKKNSVLEKVLDITGEVLAVLTIVLYAVLIINANWTFIPEGLFFDILLILKNYAALIVVLIVSFEAMVKRGFVVKLAFTILLAIIILFQFFPGTWENITQLF